jgi:hypothetical protein
MRGPAWDINLREGEARQDAFVHAFLKSRIEHKRDKRCTEWTNGKRPTGNLCIEFEQSDGRGGKKPSGIALTQADYWAFEFRLDNWLVTPTERVKDLARRAIHEGLVKPTGDNGNRSALVPIKYFIEPVEFKLAVAA